ncbi:hypothetical protein [Piscirickettsia salmonis]|uniref:hypothetical protein n=1 Tax=Piscirickettsia salmonis TaxID=1238 RepID=UPI0007C92D92|nr:hypothetical protein A0O36_02671 [Piscirickettsiaceae bacterium NZ-RLO1]
MKLDEIKKLLREGDIESITPEVLNQLGERYLEKLGKKKGTWSFVVGHTGFHHHQDLARELAEFKPEKLQGSGQVYDRRDQALQCIDKLFDVMRKLNSVESSWLARSMIALLNTALGTNVRTQNWLSTVSLGTFRVSPGEVVENFQKELLQCVPARRMTYRVKQDRGASQDQRVELLLNLLRSTCIPKHEDGTPRVGGNDVYFNGEKFQMPKGIYNALNFFNLLKGGTLTLDGNMMSCQELKGGLTSLIQDYSKKNQAFKVKFYKSRSRETSLMYDNFEKGDTEKYFQAEPVCSGPEV